MKLIALRNSHSPQVASWNIQLHKDEGSIPMQPEDAEHRIRAWLSTGRFHGYLFELDEKIVGYILFEERPADPELRGSMDATYIRQFFITRDNRRKGIGRLAFNQFVAHLNPDRLLLDVKVTNPIGQRFWESLGFVPEHIAYHRDGGK